MIKERTCSLLARNSFEIFEIYFFRTKKSEALLYVYKPKFKHKIVEVTSIDKD